MSNKEDMEVLSINSSLLDVEVNPALQTVKNNSVEIRYKAQMLKTFWTTITPSYWDYQSDRHYFHVLENGYETNKPIVMPTFLKFIPCIVCCRCTSCITWCFEQGLCSCVPRNNFCNGADVITKSYFDRGVFDRQPIGFDGYCGNDPILGGTPKVYEGSTQFVCCQVDCPEMGNQFMECYFTEICGGRVSVQTYQTIFGVDLVSCWLFNCFSLCGPKDGQPLCLQEVVRCLVPGDAKPLRDNLERSYDSWATRLAKKQNK